MSKKEFYILYLKNIDYKLCFKALWKYDKFSIENICFNFISISCHGPRTYALFSKAKESIKKPKIIQRLLSQK